MPRKGDVVWQARPRQRKTAGQGSCAHTSHGVGQGRFNTASGDWGAGEAWGVGECQGQARTLRHLGA